MKNIRLILIVFLLFRLCLAGVQAQETIPAAGGDASGIEGSASYSVGQVVFTTITGIDGIARQGVQQPFDITVSKGSENTLKFRTLCSVYPNPVTDQLRLRIESKDEIPFSTLSYRLYNSDGKLIQKKNVANSETLIPMKNLKPSAYILQVLNNKQAISEFTIIKNQ